MIMFNVTYRYGMVLVAQKPIFWYNLCVYLQLVKKNLEKFIGSSAFADVKFELDDGKMKSHRAMLIARCDMMRAMLNGDFREAHAHTVNTLHILFATSIVCTRSMFNVYSIKIDGDI